MPGSHHPGEEVVQNLCVIFHGVVGLQLQLPVLQFEPSFKEPPHVFRCYFFVHLAHQFLKKKSSHYIKIIAQKNPKLFCFNTLVNSYVELLVFSEESDEHLNFSYFASSHCSLWLEYVFISK